MGPPLAGKGNQRPKALRTTYALVCPICKGSVLGAAILHLTPTGAAVQAPAASASDRPNVPVEDFFSPPPRTYDLWAKNSQMTGRVLQELDAMQRQVGRGWAV